ncbi:MAG TPA: heavy metal translocating P-type ATPase [Candidatus Binatia bacterium]|nr:heavy metal translocating P-type ATPase [Candidatus Binatia bacterium]
MPRQTMRLTAAGGATDAPPERPRAGSRPPGEGEVVLTVHGMTCAGCVATVERALRSAPGVASAEVNLATEEARVHPVAGSSPSVAALVSAVERAGYRAAPRAATSSSDRERAHRAEEGALRARLFLSVALGVPIMALHLFVHDQDRARWLAFLLATPVQWIAAWPFHARALKALRHKTADMNTLITLGTFSAYFYSAAVTLAPEPFRAAGAGTHVYFDTAVMILVFILLGRLLESRARRRTGDALKALLTRRPPTARRLRAAAAGDEPGFDAPRETVPVESVARGDLLEILPGEVIPVDGLIAQGRTEVDESMLTGEPFPVPREPGDPVAAGTVNRIAPFVLRATRVGAETTLARIARLVEEAQGGKAPMQELADRVAARFVPAVIAIAIAAAAIWLFVGPEPRTRYALTVFVSVLIVACPCAMGLATPTAILAGTGAGARRGILIRGGEALERAGSLTTVVFDKTGTLTRGEPVVGATAAAPGIDPARLIAVAAAVEAGSEHPLARAVARQAAASGAATLHARDVRVTPGGGVEGIVEGVPTRVGSRSFAARGAEPDAALAARAEEAAERGRTVAWVGESGLEGVRLLGFFEVTDPPREDAAAAVARLRARGLKPVLATGDREAPARALAQAVGLEEVRAGLTPEGKVALVRELQARGETVAMVGDGLNDAPALAAADLGIALGTGTDAAMEAADVTLVRGSMDGIAAALDLSRATRSTVRQNLFWAFAYNVIAIPVAAGALYPAAGILLHPTVASAAMALSSVSVVTNSLRLAGWRGRPAYANFER